MNAFDKPSLIQRVRGLAFPDKEYWVVAGGAMVLHGFRPQTHDIDLGCSRSKRQALPNCRNDGRNRLLRRDKR